MSNAVSNLTTLYATSLFNRELATDHPPQLPFEVEDPVFREKLTILEAKKAYIYDYYNTFVNLSSRSDTTGMRHIMVCPAFEPGERDYVTETGVPGRIVIVEDERALFAEAHKLVQASVTMLAGGGSIVNNSFAGWQISTELWPRIVNKLFSYGYSVPKILRTDLNVRFSNVRSLIDVSAIYAQGINMTLRRLPALSDVLEFWGCPEFFDDGTRRHASSAQINDLICTDPVRAAKFIDAYTIDMHNVIQRYLGD